MTILESSQNNYKGVKEMKKNLGIKKYLATTKEVVEELKKTVDNFTKREIDEKEFENIICEYYTIYKELLYKDNELRTTVKNSLGKRRLMLVERAINELEEKINN